MKHAFPAAFVLLVSIIAWQEIAQQAQPLAQQQPKVPQNWIRIGTQALADASKAAQERWNALKRPYETSH